MNKSNPLWSIVIIIVAYIAWAIGDKLIYFVCQFLPFPGYSMLFFECLFATFILYPIYELGRRKTAAVFTIILDILFILPGINFFLKTSSFISIVPSAVCIFIISAYSVWAYRD